MPIFELRQYLKLHRRHFEKKREEEMEATRGGIIEPKPIGQVAPAAHPI
jgi:hypothetical protein